MLTGPLSWSTWLSQMFSLFFILLLYCASGNEEDPRMSCRCKRQEGVKNTSGWQVLPLLPFRSMSVRNNNNNKKETKHAPIRSKSELRYLSSHVAPKKGVFFSLSSRTKKIFLPSYGDLDLAFAVVAALPFFLPFCVSSFSLAAMTFFSASSCFPRKKAPALSY